MCRDSQQMNKNWLLNVYSDSPAEKWRSHLLLVSYGQLLPFKSILRLLQEVSVARLQSISAGTCNSDLSLPLRLQSIFACFKGRSRSFSACHLMQDAAALTWICVGFLVGLSFYMLFICLLHYNYFQPPNFCEVFKPTTFHTLWLKKATHFSCSQSVK